ncbi:MAG: hypothetical protein PHP23_01655 [Desulfobacterales bacterium]|nr:hypothetical protein [Desulfobacterales bacterium]MDD4071395.1 hypothetical protein [Desulfobacterales bacterium]MDD4391440.1 hypothetical protein [Desulfobacterales bacterium]
MKTAKDIDWRTKHVSQVTKDCFIKGKKISAGTACYSPTSTIQDSTEVSFPPPSPTALFLSIAFNNFKSSKPLYNEIIKSCLNDEFTGLFNYFEYTIASIIFSFNALESYANDKIVEDKYYEKKFKSGIYGALSSKRIEWLSLDEKIGNVLPQQLNVKTPKGTVLWEAYIRLRKLRNKIVHVTTKDQNKSNINTGMYPENIWSDLLQSHDENYPEISINIILHFEDKNKLPHWLKYNKIKKI